mmetsp:Transcript_2328/g.1646  ORF Transcript_2328/g.1646 Transcript_2328/m.1646 type:complete len:163 (+) Transcript_2328:36-524(+)
MKTSVAIAAACIASASAFAPANNGAARASTELMAEKKSFFRTIFEMDLFAPVSDQNDYGARNKKNLSVGTIGSNSYVPKGLTKEQYAAIRKKEDEKKKANYQKNVAKAGKFLDYTQFYLDRGTDVGEKWFQSPTRGHRMAKTKYDWSGKTDPSKKQETGLKK